MGGCSTRDATRITTIDNRFGFLSRFDYSCRCFERERCSKMRWFFRHAKNWANSLLENVSLVNFFPRSLCDWILLNKFFFAYYIMCFFSKRDLWRFYNSLLKYFEYIRSCQLIAIFVGDVFYMKKIYLSEYALNVIMLCVHLMSEWKSKLSMFFIRGFYPQSRHRPLSYLFKPRGGKCYFPNMLYFTQSFFSSSVV